VRVRAEEHRWMDESGHGKNLSEQHTYLLKHAPEACTDRQGRMRKGSKWARAKAGEHRWMDESGRGKNPSEQHTYLLESMHGQTRQDAERIKWARARAEEHRWMDESGCGKNPSEQGALTTSAVHTADMFRPCLVQTNRDQDAERI